MLTWKQVQEIAQRVERESATVGLSADANLSGPKHRILPGRNWISPAPHLAQTVAIRQVPPVTTNHQMAAAFCSGCPGRPLWERFAPLPFLAVWLGSLGVGCWQLLTSSAATSQAFGIDLTCSQLILVLSLAPAAIMFVMICRGAPIAPLTTAGLGTLAATALAAVGLRFFHAQDTSLMLLVWQFGTVLVLTAAGALIGQWLQPWQHPRLEGI